MKMEVSDKVARVDMPGGATYIGQFVGRFNTKMTNCLVVPTSEIMKVAGEKGVTYLQVARGFYQAAEIEGRLERQWVGIEMSQRNSYTEDLFRE